MPISKSPREQLVVVYRKVVLTPDEEHLFPRRSEAVDLWLEIEISDGWRAALRLVPYADGQPVVAEVRIFPADHWPEREPGTWRAQVLGVGARVFEDRLDERQSPKGVRFPKIGQGVTAQHLRGVPFRVIQSYGRAFAQRFGELGSWTNDPLSITSPGSSVKILDFLHEIDQAAPELSGETALELALSGFRGAAKPTSRRRADAWGDSRVAQLAAAYIERVETGSRKPVADVARRFGLSLAQVRDALHRARTKLGIMTATTAQGRPGGQLTPYGESLLREVASKKPKRPKKRS